MRLVHIPLGVGPAQRVHPLAVLDGESVAVVCGIQLPHPCHVTYVAQIQGRRLARVARHHRRRSPRVGHAGRHAVYTVAARGVTQQIHLVGVHVQFRHSRTYRHVEKSVDMRTQPHVPVVHRSARHEIDSLGGSVQHLLVLPLAVVHLGGHIAAAVQRYVEAAAVGRLLAENLVPEFHARVVANQFAILPHGAALLPNALPTLRPRLRSQGCGLALRQAAIRASRKEARNDRRGGANRYKQSVHSR